MSEGFLERLSELRSSMESFVVLTVIRTSGSTTAKVGDKMVISSDGKILHGTFGGGCPDGVIIEESLATLNTGSPRVIRLIFKEEVGELRPRTEEAREVGVPCGGEAEVYLEPYVPDPRLLIVGASPVSEVLAKLSLLLGLKVIVHAPAIERKRFPDEVEFFSGDLTDLQVNSQTYAVIATAHKYDEEALRALSSKDPAYIGLVSSVSRATLILGRLRQEGIKPNALENLHVPAGLDLGSKRPEEIAFSIIAEVLKTMRHTSGESLREVKGQKLTEFASSAGDFG